MGLTRLFVENHYAVLAPDSRGHGRSGGDVVTYGLREADDLHRWVDWLMATERPRNVFEMGESLGAAVLLQSLVGERRSLARWWPNARSRTSSAWQWIGWRSAFRGRWQWGGRLRRRWFGRRSFMRVGNMVWIFGASPAEAVDGISHAGAVDSWLGGYEYLSGAR